MAPVSLGLAPGDAPVRREAVAERSGVVLDAATTRVVRPARELHFPAPTCAGERDGLEVHRARIRCRAVRARADATLDLHRLDAVAEVDDVLEVEALVLGLVER